MPIHGGFGELQAVPLYRRHYILCFTYVVLCPFNDKFCFFILLSVSDAMYNLYSNITLVYVRYYYVL